MTHQASESKSAAATGDTYGSMLENFSVDELVDFLIATHADPAGCAESDPAEWGPEWDRWRFVPSDEDAEWWAGQDREGGCCASDLSPEDRRLAQCTSALLHHRDTMGGER